MSYESEERYWTDYLRVALPVIGLLLMLALFWWWAQNFIGDENNPEEQAAIIQTQVATQPAPTPTETVAVVVQATEVENTPDPNETSTTLGEETPTDNGSDCGFAPNDKVVTTDEVRMRSSPDTSTDDNILETLPAGTELRIVGDCFETDDSGNDFWEIKVSETAAPGWVSADYIEANTE